MTDSATDPNQPPVSAQLRGETVAYAINSGIYNLGANLFEPYLNYRLQEHHAKSQPAGARSHGNYAQNLGGELAGDITGTAALILAETFFSEPLHRFSRAARGCVDPLYASAARVVFASERGEPDYEKKVEKWKTFQGRNLVRSSVMLAGGMAGNIAAQKFLLQNPSPAQVIFQGKLLSSALTTTLGLATRLAFPNEMSRADKWLGQKLAPMMEEEETAPPIAGK